MPHDTRRLEAYATAAGLSLSLVVGVASAVAGLGESLWLDELHTAWAAGGPLGEVWPRAALGNQLPLYFWWQWLVGQTVGQSELGLRATSLLAWAGVLASLVWMLAGRARVAGQWFVVGLVGLVALDRNQLFFATEARPYAVLALVNLLAWWRLAAIDELESTHRTAWWNIAGWLGLNLLGCGLQPVMVLSWVAQWCVLGMRALHARGQRAALLRRLLAASCVLAIVCVPIAWLLAGTWHARSAWAAFAGDASPANVLRQLPILAVALPVVIGCAIRWLLRRSVKSTLQTPIHRQVNCLDDRQWFWLSAWAIPLALAVGLTATGIAPLMHPRYLFAASPLLIVWAASAMQGWSNKLGWLTVTAMVMTLVIQQGTLAAWSRGKLAGPVRGEDWRGVRETIVQANEPRPVIFCVSSLIEGNTHIENHFSPPLLRDSLSQAYFSMPLQSLYRPGAQADVIALLNDPKQWKARIEPAIGDRDGWWLAVRCSKAGLVRRLELAGLKPQSRYDFGGVQLVRFHE